MRLKKIVILFNFYLATYSQKIENEYGDVENAYGENGWKYVEWCSDLVNSFEVGVPWIMCKQDNAPFPIVLSIYPLS